MNWKYHEPKFEYEEDFQDIAWPWSGHKSFAYDLVANIQPKLIVELGTHKGTSLFSFAQSAKDNKIDVEINAVDTWEGEKHAGFYGEEVIEGVKDIKEKYYNEVNINLLRKTFDEAIDDFEDKSIDILHIDGLHTYEAVKHDFNSWIGKVSNDGIVLFHDIKVTERGFGVYKLWNELKKKYKTIEFSHSFGLGILFINDKIARDFLNIEKVIQMNYLYIHEISRIEFINQKEQQIQQYSQEINQKEQQLRQQLQKINQKNYVIQEQAGIINQKDQQIQQHSQEINQKEQQLRQMQSSKFWKMRNVYIHYKSGIKQGIKNPRLFLKFIKKRIYKLYRIKKTIDKSDIGNNKNFLKSYDINTVKEMVYDKFKNIQDIQCINIDSDKFRFNIVTDSISKNSLFGGVATSLILATLFSNKYKIPLRIIVRNTEIIPSDFVNFLKMCKIDIPKEVTFFTDYERNNENFNRKLEISKKDIFLATSWWSSRVIEKINQRNVFFHILQEVEEMFYDNGDEKLMCNQMLNRPNIKYLINTELLFKFYKNNGYAELCKNSCIFEPAFLKHMYNIDINYINNKSGKKRLFFYARPNNHRNLFYTGIQFLNSAISEGVIDTNEWEICLAGSEDIQAFKFINGSRPTLLGVMNWKEYLQFLRTVDLGFCLMYTPHPSYPPLDIVACGGVVLTNKYENKINLGDKYSKNIILAELNNEDMMNGFKSAIELSNDREKRMENFKNNKLETNWLHTLEKTVVFMNKNK